MVDSRRHGGVTRMAAEEGLDHEDPDGRWRVVLFLFVMMASMFVSALVLSLRPTIS